MEASIKLPILFAVGLAAGFVDSIAGGGGLLTLPSIIGVGYPAEEAMGINKLQAVFGSAGAAWNYWRLGAVSLRECLLGVFFTVIGAAAGALLITKINPVFLQRAIPVLLLAITVLVLARPQLGEKDIHPRMPAGCFYVIAGLVLGFYDGFFGPGVGKLWAMAFTLGLGFNLVKATAYTKVMNAASNMTALAVFLRAGQVEYTAGLTMGVGQLIGAKIGSGMVVSKGARFIRPVFIAMAVSVMLKLLYEAYFKK